MVLEIEDGGCGSMWRCPLAGFGGVWSWRRKNSACVAEVEGRCMSPEDVRRSQFASVQAVMASGSTAKGSCGDSCRDKELPAGSHWSATTLTVCVAGMSGVCRRLRRSAFGAEEEEGALPMIGGEELASCAAGRAARSWFRGKMLAMSC